MTSIIHPVVLCGGSGSRLWPLSTHDRPKQFLALTSNKSMIELTVDRFDRSLRPDLSFAQPLVVGAKRHARLLNDTLPNVKKILEPVGRNSAPAVAAACLSYEPDDLIVVLPADHDIKDVPAFHDAISIAVKAAHSGSIVTFGVKPTHPATEYGYLKMRNGSRIGEAQSVEEFTEKPNSETAQRYVDAGAYLWNAGIFLFKVRVMLEALQKHAPGVLSGTHRAMAGKSGNLIHLDEYEFAATPSISIDYAVLEQAKNVRVVPVNMGWSDVGGYRSLHELLTRTHAENYTSGPVHIQNSTGSYVRSEGPAVTINGVSDLVVVATPDEVMITPMSMGAAVNDLRKVVRTRRHKLGYSESLLNRARDWLWTAFDVWSEKGWDQVRGGFVEQLDENGTPDAKIDRRVRVQARQVFSFAKAIELGWPGVHRAKFLVNEGIDYIDTKLRHKDGGWVHVVSANGMPIDNKRDLYDHAFIILAGTAAYKATGSQRALNVANDAIGFIDAELKDHDNGGWFEAKPAHLPRRTNPHMHLLEAMMAYYSATGCKKALKRASEVVELFETRFFQPATNVLAEYFTKNWSIEEGDDEIIWQPGHHYEWATLLRQYEQVTNRDTLSWRRRLIRKADTVGINPKTGFALNELRANGSVIDSHSRLWHQLEMLRSHLVHPTVSPPHKMEALFDRMFESFLDRGSDGDCIDEIDVEGWATVRAVPASTIYHAVTAFETLLAAH